MLLVPPPGPEPPQRSAETEARAAELQVLWDPHTSSLHGCFATMSFGDRQDQSLTLTAWDPIYLGHRSALIICPSGL